jgi:trk system potassium uptake protein TrkA
MNVLIVGCGRVGSELAYSLDREGHEVTIVDVIPAAFERLERDFGGRTVQGFCFDRELLDRAGIRHADAFAATTASDNANIVAAKVARDYFNVKRVVARVYNPRRREVYERLGFQTVASSSWGAWRIEQLLLYPGVIDMEQIGYGEVNLLSIHVPPQWYGLRVDNVLGGAAVVCAVKRDGHAFVPGHGEQLRAGDIAYFSVPDALMPEVIGLTQSQRDASA